MSGRTCPECQAPIESGALDGMCPRCLAGLLFDPGPVPETSGEETTATVPPMTTRSVLLELPGYEVTRELARGGMGIVYQATQLEPRREVALKMLLPHQLEAAEFRERFLLEARAIARLEHPHILPVYQVGEHDGVPYFTMKLAAGGTLAERRQRYRRSWREIAELLATLADAVQYAHERGVLHRDLKPGNVLFDDKGRPYVSDFGLAKLADDTMPDEAPGQVIGTPRYVAPEVAGQGSELATVASDIYGLGIILYELLAQKTPFVALSHQALLRMVADAPPPPPRNELKGVPHELDIICMRCLEKDPERRFQTAGSLAQELRRWLDGRPIDSIPATRREQVWRWLREQQAVVGLTAAIAVLGMVLVVGSVWTAFSLAASRRAILEQRDRARDDLVAARLGEARGLRLSGQIRVRSRAVNLLTGAAEAAPVRELRDEAAALLGQWDVGPDEERHRHAGVGLPMALSGALDLVAEAGAEGEVRLWRRATGAVLWQTKPGPIPRAVAFSSGARWVAIVGSHGVRVIEVATGRSALEIDGRWLGFSSDEVLAVVQGTEREVAFHNIGAARRVLALPLASDALGAVAVSDRPVVPEVLVQWRDHLEVIDPTNAESTQWLPFHRGEVRAIGWQDGCILAGDNTGGLRLWNLRTGRLRDLPGHRGAVESIVMGLDGTLAWTVSKDGESRLWHVRTGQVLGQTRLWQPIRFAREGNRLAYVDGAHFGVTSVQVPVGLTAISARSGGEIRHVEFSPDGRWIIVAGQGGLTLADPSSGVIAWHQPMTGIASAHFEPSGKRIAVVHRLGVRWLQLVEEGRRIRLAPAGEVLPPESAWLLRALGDGDGRTLLIPTGAGRLLGFDLVAGGWITVPQLHSRVDEAATDPERKWLVVSTREPRLEVRPFGGGDVVAELEPGFGRPAFSPDGRHLLVAGGELHQVLTTPDWRPRMVEPTGAGNMTRGMGRWSRYGRAFAVSGPRSGIVVVSTESWRPIVHLLPSLPVTCLAFSPYGRQVVVGTDDDHVLLWNLQELRQGLAPLGLDWREEISPDLPAGTVATAWLPASIPPVPGGWAQVRARDRGSKPEVLDLSGHLNEPLDAPGMIHTGPRERPADFPVGQCDLRGIPSDIRGYIRLAGASDVGEGGKWPEGVGWIPVGRNAPALTIVSSALAELGQGSEMEICRFRVRWVDGVEKEWPFRSGNETGPWLRKVGDGIRQETGKPAVAWEGLSEVSEAMGAQVSLYAYRWENPRSEIKVESIRWLGAGRSAGLRIVGVTLSK